MIAPNPDVRLALLLKGRPPARHDDELVQPADVRPEGYTHVIGVVGPQVHHALQVERAVSLCRIALIEPQGQAALDGLIAGVQCGRHDSALAMADQVRRRLHLPQADDRPAAPRRRGRGPGGC